MFVELLITACLGASAGPDRLCRDFSLLYDPQQVGLLTCTVAGMGEVARWKARNARWQVSRWHCGVSDGTRFDA